MINETRLTYLEEPLSELKKQWPENRTINIVCHGHSVPSGYFSSPVVDTFHAYPFLLHKELKQRFPFAVINVIVTAIGGETSLTGSERFESDVLNHRPDIVTIDYGLNDRGMSLDESERNWKRMIEESLKKNVKVILMTPSWDNSYFLQDVNWMSLVSHAEQIRKLAAEYSIGLCDSFAAFQAYIDAGGDLSDLLSHINHPNDRGHKIIALELARWFLAGDRTYGR